MTSRALVSVRYGVRQDVGTRASHRGEQCVSVAACAVARAVAPTGSGLAPRDVRSGCGAARAKLAGPCVKLLLLFARSPGLRDRSPRPGEDFEAEKHGSIQVHLASRSGAQQSDGLLNPAEGKPRRHPKHASELVSRTRAQWQQRREPIADGVEVCLFTFRVIEQRIAESRRVAADSGRRRRLGDRA